jgi:hypothetical protein
MGKRRKHHPEVATAATLDALGRGVQIEAVKIPVAQILLQESRPRIEGLLLTPLKNGGLQRVKDGSRTLITMHSINNRIKMRAAASVISPK